MHPTCPPDAYDIVRDHVGHFISLDKGYVRGKGRNYNHDELRALFSAGNQRTFLSRLYISFVDIVFHANAIQRNTVIFTQTSVCDAHKDMRACECMNACVYVCVCVCVCVCVHVCMYLCVCLFQTRLI